MGPLYTPSALKHSPSPLRALRRTRNKPIAATNTTGSNYGKITVTIINTDNDLKPVKEMPPNIGGRIMSNVVISFENFVMILPKGFWSKNRILALITFSRIALCKPVVL